MTAALRSWLCAVGAILAAQSLGLLQPPGLDFVHRNSPTSRKYLPETMGGGVALIDFDNDGLLDVFLVNGGRLEDPVRQPEQLGRDQPAFWNRLYRQSKDGSFADVTKAAGLSEAGNNYGMGAAAADIDNDGDADLYVTNYGRNQLYRNNGKGVFEDVTKVAGAFVGGWSVSAGFLDYDNDGLLDLFVARYLDWDFRRNILCGVPFQAYCRPDKFEGVSNVLLHNEGGGRFRDVSVESGIAAVKGKGMGVAIDDYDDDGFPDIFVANDGIEQFLFHNRKDGSFEEVAVEAGVAYSDDGRTFAGMGAAFADYDNDGRPDILVTNLALEKYALYENEGSGRFSYASLTSGLARLSARSSGWGVGLHDFDNDGWKDIVAAQSHVLDNVERIQPTLRYREPPAHFRNAHGRFESQPAPAWPAVAGRGAAFGDLDNDGAMDAVISVLGGKPIVLKGRAPQRSWLSLKLVGVHSNRDGIGAKVRIGDQRVQATTAGSYLASNDRRTHFGLDSSRTAVVEIHWPGGARQILRDVPGGQILTVKEPE